MLNHAPDFCAASRDIPHLGMIWPRSSSGLFPAFNAGHCIQAENQMQSKSNAHPRALAQPPKRVAFPANEHGWNWVRAKRPAFLQPIFVVLPDPVIDVIRHGRSGWFNAAAIVCRAVG